jgi:hypothetical protein
MRPCAERACALRDGAHVRRHRSAHVISIAAINAWNRINATTRQVTGEWVEQLLTKEPAAQAM